MAYRTDVNNRDRGGAIAAVAAIHAALLFAFLHMAGTIDLRDTQSALQLFDLSRNVPPPPPEVQQQPKLKERSGAASPNNLRSQATPVVAPKPKVVTPPVQKIVASETPRMGTAPTQGASNVPGSGTGAGGSGAGTGSGAGGRGSGGGDGGVAEPPRLVSPVLGGYDFAPELLDQWPPRATVFLRLRIDARGYVAECTVDRGTGVGRIDGIMCNLAHDRLRFRPALNTNGEAVAGWVGYAQPAPR